MSFILGPGTKGYEALQAMKGDTCLHHRRRTFEGDMRVTRECEDTIVTDAPQNNPPVCAGPDNYSHQTDVSMVNNHVPDITKEHPSASPDIYPPYRNNGMIEKMLPSCADEIAEQPPSVEHENYSPNMDDFTPENTLQDFINETTHLSPSYGLECCPPDVNNGKMEKLVPCSNEVANQPPGVGQENYSSNIDMDHVILERSSTSDMTEIPGSKIEGPPKEDFLDEIKEHPSNRNQESYSSGMKNSKTENTGQDDKVTPKVKSHVPHSFLLSHHSTEQNTTTSTVDAHGDAASQLPSLSQVLDPLLSSDPEYSKLGEAVDTKVAYISQVGPPALSPIPQLSMAESDVTTEPPSGYRIDPKLGSALEANMLGDKANSKVPNTSQEGAAALTSVPEHSMADRDITHQFPSGGGENSPLSSDLEYSMLGDISDLKIPENSQGSTSALKPVPEHSMTDVNTIYPHPGEKQVNYPLCLDLEYSMLGDISDPKIPDNGQGSASTLQTAPEHNMTDGDTLSLLCSDLEYSMLGDFADTKISNISPESAPALQLIPEITVTDSDAIPQPSSGNKLNIPLCSNLEYSMLEDIVDPMIPEISLENSSALPPIPGHSMTDSEITQQIAGASKEPDSPLSPILGYTCTSSLSEDKARPTSYVGEESNPTILLTVYGHNTTDGIATQQSSSAFDQTDLPPYPANSMVSDAVANKSSEKDQENEPPLSFHLKHGMVEGRDPHLSTTATHIQEKNSPFTFLEYSMLDDVVIQMPPEESITPLNTTTEIGEVKQVIQPPFSEHSMVGGMDLQTPPFSQVTRPSTSSNKDLREEFTPQSLSLYGVRDEEVAQKPSCEAKCTFPYGINEGVPYSSEIEGKILPSEIDGQIQSSSEIDGKIQSPSEIDDNFPSSSKINGKIPSLSEIDGEIPSSSKINGKIPSLSEIDGKIQSPAQIDGEIQSPSKICGKIPSLSEIDGEIQSPSETDDKILSPSELDGKIPGSTDINVETSSPTIIEEEILNPSKIIHENSSAPEFDEENSSWTSRAGVLQQLNDTCEYEERSIGNPDREENRGLHQGPSPLSPSEHSATIQQKGAEPSQQCATYKSSIQSNFEDIKEPTEPQESSTDTCDTSEHAHIQVQEPQTGKGDEASPLYTLTKYFSLQDLQHLQNLLSVIPPGDVSTLVASLKTQNPEKMTELIKLMKENGTGEVNSEMGNTIRAGGSGEGHIVNAQNWEDWELIDSRMILLRYYKAKEEKEEMKNDDTLTSLASYTYSIYESMRRQVTTLVSDTFLSSQ